MKKFFLIFPLIFGILASGLSQVQVKISDQTVNLNGKKFYLHKVEQGQTLYSISKAYKVSQEDIKSANNLTSTEVKSGQLLKIPYSDMQNADASPDFFYHKVKKGETLFSLSQKYYVSIEEIIDTNPDVKYGLKTDQILKIPNSFKKKREDNNYFNYTVEKENTLFSIAQKFNVSVDDITELNKGSENGINEGQTLKIPKKSDDNISENNDINDTITEEKNLNKGLNDPLYFTEPGITPCNQFQYTKNKSFNVVLLLPLFIEKNLYYIKRYNKEKDPMFYKNTKRFTEFYEGVLLALQKVKDQGLSVNLKVYDTENDSLKVKNIMGSLNYPNVDLIIGPVYTGNVKIAAEYAERNHINIVSPLSKRLSQLKNNPFLFQAVPSTQAKTDKLSQLLSTKHDSTNIILVYDGSITGKKIIDRFETNYTLYDSLDNLTDSSVFKIIKYDTDIKKMNEEQIKINKALEAGYRNIVFIPSDNEVFVTQIIDKFYAADDSYNIEIVGSERWINFQNFNTATFQKLSFNFVSAIYTDYNLPEVKDFIQTYRMTYETEPSKYAFEGYDITYYFLNALRKYGRIFQFCLSSDDVFPNPKGLIYNFDFERINLNGGFENKEAFILKLNDKFQTEKTNFDE